MKYVMYVSASEAAIIAETKNQLTESHVKYATDPVNALIAMEQAE